MTPTPLLLWRRWRASMPRRCRALISFRLSRLPRRTFPIWQVRALTFPIWQVHSPPLPLERRRNLFARRTFLIWQVRAFTFLIWQVHSPPLPLERRRNLFANLALPGPLVALSEPMPCAKITCAR